MKKIIVSLCILLMTLFSLGSMAQQVDMTTAKSRAISFLQQSSQRRFVKGKHVSAPKYSSSSQLSLAYTAKQGDEVHFYVFNCSDGGFVIVGGDEVAEDIIGYSEKGQFDADDMPSNLKAWFGYYEQAISSAIAEEKSNPSGYRQVARSVFAQATSYSEIPYLVQTQWDQEDPFNNMCPKKNGERCLTGCVATAMAQVMNYHQWPVTGTGSHSYYDTECRQTLSSNFYEHTYRWDLMENKTNYYHFTTTEEKNAVAQLMYDCGVSVDMGYDPEGSGAFSDAIPDALIDYFGYATTARYVQKSSYSQSAWTELLYNELAAGRPILYAGDSRDGGHQFICDGYQQSTGKFHFNWGWNGEEDGYFTFNPLGKSYNFSQNQDAVIGIKPNAGFAVSTSTLNLGRIGVGEAKTAQFTVTPNNLGHSISLSTTIGSLSTTTIAQTTTTAQTITFSLTPTVAGEISGTITISDGTTSHNIAITGTAGYAITVVDADHGLVLSEDFAAPGETIDILTEADEDYIMTALTVTGNTSGQTVTISPELSSAVTDYTFVMPSEAVTINSTFAPAPTYTITWMSNGQLFTTTEVVAGKALTLPTTTPSAEGYVFRGWTDTPSVNSDGTAITYITNSVKPSDATTYYAVFAQSETGSSPTSIVNMESGDYYIVDTYENDYYAMKGFGTNFITAVDISSAVTENNGIITIDQDNEAIDEDMIYHVAYNGETATIYNVFYETYIGSSSSTSFTESDTDWDILAEDSRFAFFYGNRGILFRSGTGFKNYANQNRDGSDYSSGFLYLVNANGGNFTNYTTSLVTVDVTGVTLSDATTVLKIGQTQQLTATVTPENASNKNVTWTSSNDEVATVANGNITAIAAGTTTITVTTTDGSFTATCEVTVTPLDTYTITWMSNGETYTTTSVVEGNSLVLPATDPSESGYEFMGWTNTSTVNSDGTSITYIDESVMPTGDATYCAVFAIASQGGEVTAESLTLTYSSHQGWTIDADDKSSYYVLSEDKSITSPVISFSELTSIVITARTYGGAAFCEVDITAGEQTIGSISAATNKMADYTFTPTGTWSGKTPITFSSSTTSSANGPGIQSITINYKTNGGTTYSGYTTITSHVSVTGVSIEQSAINLVVGGADQTLTATVTPDNASNQNVTWTSSDESVATVTNGVVHPVGAGTAIITATTADGGFTATCTATVTAPEQLTITLMNAGQTYGTINAFPGVTFGLFVLSEPQNGGFEFVGWTNQSTVSKDVIPEIISADYEFNDSETLYAVYKYPMGGTTSYTTQWTLVTDDSTIQVGDEIVITSNTKGAIAGDIASQIMTAEDATFSNDCSIITKMSDDALIFTVGGSDGQWTLSNADGQKLGATAAKKLSWTDGTTTWDISISNGDATIQNGTSSNGRILYNVGSPRFTTYTSNLSTSMLLPQIYRKTMTPTSDAKFGYTINKGYTLAITDVEWATFYANDAVEADYDFDIYTATLSNTQFFLHEASTEVVPANTPVVINGAPGQYGLIVTSETATMPSNNLSGTSVRASYAELGGNNSYYVYTLNNGSTGIGFYKMKDTSSLAANRAYLLVPQALFGSEAKGLPFIIGESDGIKNITADENINSIFDMQGRKVNGNVNSLNSGLYIINGKKTYIRK